MQRRVVVTGLGCVTPLGGEVDQVWNRLVAGESGIGPIGLFDTTGFPVKIAAEVGRWSLAEVGEDPEAWKHHPRQTSFALGAAVHAVRSSGIDDAEVDPVRFGVYLGCGETYPSFSSFGSRIAGAITNGRYDPGQFMRGCLRNGHPDTEYQYDLNLPAYLLGALFNAQGFNANCTAACVSSSMAIGEAAQIIGRGEADVMLCGGAHSMIHPFGLTGFHRLSVLSTRNDATAMRPFDRNRDGFVVGEGAAMVVLEEFEQARRRGADIWGELVGFASTQNAYRITDSHPNGRGISDCIRQALDDARLNVDQVDYINAHGTSTIENDRVESVAINEVFGARARQVPISSSKSMMGHFTTACGAIDLVVCMKTLRAGVVHPTINYETPDPECNLDYVPNTARKIPCRHIISNSFGFGGQNVVLVVSRV